MRTFIFSLFVLVAFARCSKTGATGATGPQGPAGNPNITVDTFSVANAGWIWNSGYSYTQAGGASTTWFTRYHDQSFSKITQGILDTGMVLMYIQPYADSKDQWVPMPYQYLNAVGSFYYEYAYETSPGKVRMHYWYWPNTGTAPTTLSTDVVPTHRYKIVVIASGAVATAMRRDSVNVGDYNTVMKYLGL